MREASVVMAKCTKEKKPFGIRVEQREDMAWYCNWAFRISEQAAANEGYGNTVIDGIVKIDGDYPGCPYCGATGWVRCGQCGKLTCQASGEEFFQCEWCGNSGKSVMSDKFKLTGGGY